MKKTNQNQSDAKLSDVTKKLAKIKSQWQRIKSVENIDVCNQDEVIGKKMQLEQIKKVSETNNNVTLVPQVMTQDSLNWKQKIRRIPFLGYVAASVKALTKLPQIRQYLAQVQHQVEQMQLQLALHSDFIEAQNILTQQYKKELLDLRELHVLMDRRMTQSLNRLDRYDALDIGKRLMQFDQMQLERHNKSIKLMMHSHNQREITLLARIEKLESALNKQRVMPKTLPHAALLNTESSSMESAVINNMQQDSFYADFEDVFRGSREDIKERLTIYLPFIRKIPLDQNSNKRLVIDLGCGRGEWLELLDENGIPGIGVDLNVKMVDICLEQGLLARCADAIHVLREQTPGSVGAITGFHIIEHLPFEALIAMFDAALEALCIDGVIIFETPNPENLKVGACNFYFDPTHLNPIVPQVAEFMAKQRGFAHAEILRIHPYPDKYHLKGDTEIEKLINKEFFGSQDYAVIGRK